MFIRRRPGLARGVLILLSIVAGFLYFQHVTPLAFAQMVSGARIKHFDDVLDTTPGLLGYPYNAVQVKPGATGGIVAPGEQLTRTPQIQKKRNTPIKAAGKIERVQHRKYSRAISRRDYLAFHRDLGRALGERS